MAKEARKIIEQTKEMTPKEFVSTAIERKDAAAWLAEVESQVKLMRKDLRIPSTSNEVKRNPQQVVQAAPPWFDVLHKSNEVKCKSRSDLYTEVKCNEYTN